MEKSGRSLVPIREAAARARISPRTLRRRIAEGGVGLYREGHDRRRRFVDLLELEDLAQPRRLPRPGAEETARAIT